MEGGEQPTGGDERRSKVLAEYRSTLLHHKETDAKVRARECTRAPRSPSAQSARSLACVARHLTAFILSHPLTCSLARSRVPFLPCIAHSLPC